MRRHLFLIRLFSWECPGQHDEIRVFLLKLIEKGLEVLGEWSGEVSEEHRLIMRGDRHKLAAQMRLGDVLDQVEKAILDPFWTPSGPFPVNWLAAYIKVDGETIGVCSFDGDGIIRDQLRNPLAACCIREVLHDLSVCRSIHFRVEPDQVERCLRQKWNQCLQQTPGRDSPSLQIRICGVSPQQFVGSLHHLFGDLWRDPILEQQLRDMLHIFLCSHKVSPFADSLEFSSCERVSNQRTSFQYISSVEHSFLSGRGAQTLFRKASIQKTPAGLALNRLSKRLRLVGVSLHEALNQ